MIRPLLLALLLLALCDPVRADAVDNLKFAMDNLVAKYELLAQKSLVLGFKCGQRFASGSTMPEGCRSVLDALKAQGVAP